MLHCRATNSPLTDGTNLLNVPCVCVYVSYTCFLSHYLGWRIVFPFAGLSTISSFFRCLFRVHAVASLSPIFFMFEILGVCSLST